MRIGSTRPNELPPRPNYQIYKASVDRTYFVAGTSVIPTDSDEPVRGEDFTQADVDGLAADIIQAYSNAPLSKDSTAKPPIPITLRVHGYNTRRKDFEKSVLEDAKPELHYPRGAPPGFDPTIESFRPDGAFYIGFWWQSEGLASWQSFRDTARALSLSPAVGWLLFLLPIAGLLTVRFGPDWYGRNAWLRQVFLPFVEPTTSAVLLGAGLLLILLRLSTYLRDRYRALHYGIPDFGEFVRALERRLRGKAVVRLNVIGHSMGTLVLINAFRVMSDYFARDDGHRAPEKSLGPRGTLELGTMIVCAADIPALMATPDHNNYFLSALRRFDSMHVFSSDRDVMLKWLSLIANWAIEPRFDMAGRKLGNALLIRSRAAWEAPAPAGENSLWPVTRPVWRPFPVYERNPVVAGRGDPPAWRDTREALHFHDCTEDPSLSGPIGMLAVTLTVLAVGGAVVSWGLHRLWRTDPAWVWPPLLVWLALALGGLMAVGLLCRLMWPWARDRGKLGGILGMFTDWPTLLVFLWFWRDWNPHSGYFAFGRPPRRRISALLRNDPQWPPLGPEGRPVGEVTIGMRYRRIDVSV